MRRRSYNDVTPRCTHHFRPDGWTWDVPNLWICDGSLVPTSGGVNPSETGPWRGEL
ncbi:MAG TPA: GMC oxidoreductase [Thermoanaerobaculia bacterium]|nr:GMC oxidoreductase [Thermoanaerobaculia bacterium]